MTETELIPKRLDGKIAVITGGSSGIGITSALRCENVGAFVFITGRRQDELDRAVMKIGRNVMSVQGDVSNLEDLDRLYETVKQHKGRIDVLFANAGIVEATPLSSIPESDFDKIFNINVKGLLFTVQKALPLFRDGGAIILAASIVGSKGFEGFSVYNATKAAIRSFARSWTVDLKSRKIRVNAVSPGPTATPFASTIMDLTVRRLRLSGEQVEHFKKSLLERWTPLGRLGSPDEVAKAVSFLASDDSSYITGIELFVDGGIAQI